MTEKNESEDLILIIVDEFGNEIVDGLEITIPADIAQEYGAHEDDAHTIDEITNNKFIFKEVISWQK